MKSLKNLLLLIPVLLLSCGQEEELTDKKSEGSGVYITGIKQALTYEFYSPNGRMVSEDDAITNLVIFIIGSDGNIAYEQHYYPYYDGQVPDTILIPNLAAGNYELMASTSDFYEYGYYNYEDTYYNGGDVYYDTMEMFTEMVLPSYAMSQGTIYVGYEEFTVTDEDLVLAIDMENVSAKVTFKVQNGDVLQNGGVEMALRSVSAMSYDLRSGQFREENYAYDIYNWLDQWSSSRTVYIMPTTISEMNMNYYQYYNGTSFNQTVTFDEAIELKTGDAIIFNLDMNALLDGAGDGVLNFADIEWNDLGELSVP